MQGYIILKINPPPSSPQPKLDIPDKKWIVEFPLGERWLDDLVLFNPAPLNFPIFIIVLP